MCNNTETTKQKIIRLLDDGDGGKREISITGFRHYLSASLAEVAIALDELERDKIIEETNFGGDIMYKQTEAKQ